MPNWNSGSEKDWREAKKTSLRKQDEMWIVNEIEAKIKVASLEPERNKNP